LNASTWRLPVLVLVLVASSWRSAVMMAVGPRGKAAPGGILGGRWPPCHLNASLRPPVFNARPGKTSEKHLAGRHLTESVQASGTPGQALPVALSSQLATLSNFRVKLRARAAGTVP
jgi:hypothetical protein